MILHAGDEGVAAFDAVDQPLLAQEIERAVDGDRRRPRAAQRQPVDQLIGAERLVARQQRLQHAAADRRQAPRTRGADRLGVRDRIAGATLVVVTWRREHRVGVSFFGQRSIHLHTQV